VESDVRQVNSAQRYAAFGTLVARHRAPGHENRTVCAISFDLNDTLVDVSGIRDAVLRTCNQLARLHPNFNAARLPKAIREVRQTYWPDVERDWTLGGLSGEAVGLEDWRRTFLSCGYECNEDLAQQTRTIHRRYSRQLVAPFDDVPDVLMRLSASGLILALVTNGAADDQREGLRLLDLERHFATIVISGELGVAKPEPLIFATAVATLRVEPMCIWHVGDNLWTDVAGADGAGLTSVWINRRGRP
jgi:HAD superfamily hydrolase (TIGR01509 family)